MAGVGNLKSNDKSLYSGYDSDERIFVCFSKTTNKFNNNNNFNTKKNILPSTRIRKKIMRTRVVSS